MTKQKMTASLLKLRYEQNNPNGHFFTRRNMRFAGDTMANYYVPAEVVSIDTWSRSGVQCYELQRRRPVKGGLSGSTYFEVETFQPVHKKA